MSPKTSSFADPQSWRPREPQGCEERGNALTGLVPTSASRDPALRLLGKEAPVLILKHRPEGRGFWAASSPSGGGPSFRASGSPSALLQPPGNNHPPTPPCAEGTFPPHAGLPVEVPLGLPPAGGAVVGSASTVGAPASQEESFPALRSRATLTGTVHHQLLGAV